MAHLTELAMQCAEFLIICAGVAVMHSKTRGWAVRALVAATVLAAASGFAANIFR